MEFFEYFLKEISTISKRYGCGINGEVFIETKTGRKEIAKHYPDLSFKRYYWEDDELLIDVILQIGNSVVPLSA